MPGRKRDLSRLVMLTMTPSEAVVLKAVCVVVRDRSNDKPPEVESVIRDVVDSIDLQLRYLKWPEPNQAPFPV